MPLFNSPAPPPLVRLEQVCVSLSADPAASPNSRACAWNLIHDPRVSPEWAAEWHRKYGPCHSPTELEASLYRYFNAFRERPIDAYADIVDFAGNEIPLSPAGDLKPETQLVAVLDLGSAGARMIWRHGVVRRMDILRSLGSLDLNGPLPAPLLDILGSNSVALQTPLMRTYFLAMKSYLDEAHSRIFSSAPMLFPAPVWASTWSGFQQRVEATAEDCCDAVGLSKPPARTPAYVAIIQYPARLAKHIYRPSQLEAGWFGRHFPSPPDCCKSKGGRVLDNRPGLDNQFLALPEYIHAPVAFSHDHWLVTGFPVLSTSRPIGPESDLRDDRARHHLRIMAEFPLAASWMTKANP